MATKTVSLKLIQPGTFEPSEHFYPKVLNATIHPMVAHFTRLSPERLISRYCHLHPKVDPLALSEILQYRPKYVRWAGADLFNVTTAEGNQEMVLIETNSCPSGQKSMPIPTDHQEQGGYQTLVEKVLAPAFRKTKKEQGALAVLYDKNPMGNSGYAAAMADFFQEPVYMVPYLDSDPNPPVRFRERALQIRDNQGQWLPVRGAFRYVTQKPWNRLPLDSKTPLVNPVQACLAGGRNKAIAAIAYELLNSELAGTGLEIRVPETLREVSKSEVPMLVRKMGGHAVIKVPYSNAGQGVFTITNPLELAQFMEQQFEYNQFIVQSLIGNYRWSSDGARGRFYHVGMLPNKNNQIFVADVRMMVVATRDGFIPLAVYGRRTRIPLADRLTADMDSWDMLGTNLSIKEGRDAWSSDTNRLVLMDRRDFNTLGLSLDDLIKGFVQTVLAVVAVDKMAKNLTTQKGKFRIKLYQQLNGDDRLVEEIKHGNPS